MRRLLFIPVVAGAIAFYSIALVPYPSAPVQSTPKPQSNPIPATGAANVRQWKVWRAFLRGAVFTAEGTWYEGTKLDPYRTQALSYRQIPANYAFKQHPYWSDKIIPCASTSAGRICSACTGAAQWHPDTWESVKNANKNRYWFKQEGEFSPRNQDLATLYKLLETGSFQTLMKGIYAKNGRVNVKRESFDRALTQSASVWESFPRFAGDQHGAYGQGARSSDKLWKVFQTELDKEEVLWSPTPK